MTFSIFNRFIGNDKYFHYLKSEKESINKQIQYNVNYKYTENPIFEGHIFKDTFELNKNIKSVFMKNDVSYKVKGKVTTEFGKTYVEYYLTLSKYALKHLSICIIPSLIFFFIFLNYDFTFLLIPLIYFFISDLIINFIKMKKNIMSYDHFTEFLTKIDKK